MVVSCSFLSYNYRSDGTFIGSPVAWCCEHAERQIQESDSCPRQISGEVPPFASCALVLPCARGMFAGSPTNYFLDGSHQQNRANKENLESPSTSVRKTTSKLARGSHPKWGCLKLNLRVLPYLDILHKLGVRVCTAPFRKVQAWPGAALTIKFMEVTTLGSRIVTKS